MGRMSSSYTSMRDPESATFTTGFLNPRGPPPLPSLVIDASIDLFGIVFPYVSPRHRTQMLEHFRECIRVSKAARQEAIQINIFAALLSALRKLSESKFAFGEDPALRASTINLAMVSSIIRFGKCSFNSPVNQSLAICCSWIFYSSQTK